MSILICLSVDLSVASLLFLRGPHVPGGDFVRWLDACAEWRIGQDYIEAFFKDAIHINEAVVVMHAAVSVAVHDHVHLARARHAIVCITSVDAPVRQCPEPRVTLALVDRDLQLVVLLAQRLSTLRRHALDVQPINVLLILVVNISENLLADDLEEPDEEAARSAGRVADRLPLLGLHHVHHELDDRRGVKNCPISPRNVRPRKRSKAIPFTSSLVSDRL